MVAAALGCRCGACFHVIWNQEREAAGLDQDMSEDTSRAVKVAVEGLKRLIEADRRAGKGADRLTGADRAGRQERRGGLKEKAPA